MEIDRADGYESGEAYDNKESKALKPRIASKIQRSRDLDDQNKGSIRTRRESKETGTKSIEGWVIFITNVHEEASEEDLVDAFGEHGDVRGIQMNLDRRTGFVKGYAAIEYKTRLEAQNAIELMDGSLILDQKISVSWAFVKAPERSQRYERNRNRR
mmetsp:Transcript_20325/g.30047  ORF Transcript_20325/g.30047 Transcript_20325/m.30047 type:complete len:157 (+) Transcript_20325:34-504(+)